MSQLLNGLKQSKSFNSILAVMVVMLMVTVGYVAVRSFAATSVTMYVQPASGSYTVGSTISMPVRLSADTTPINAVQVDLTYPAGLLQYVSIDSTGTAFGVDAAKSGGNGTVAIAKGNTTPVTGDSLIATVSFKVLAAGTATVGVANSSAAVTSTDSTNALTIRTGAVYTLTGGTSTPTPAATVPVYRLANFITHERLFTTSAAERDNATKNLKGWVYEGVSFNVLTSNTGANPVYRLANFITHERLFTTSAAERDNATTNLKGWVSEGTAFYIPTSGGSVTVYRLANFITHERLFTTSAAERDNATKNLKGWVSEGVAFTAY